MVWSASSGTAARSHAKVRQRGALRVDERRTRVQAGTRHPPSPEDGTERESRSRPGHRRTKPYCLSKTSVSSYALPSVCVPLLLTVSVLPSADTTRCTLPTTLPPLLSVKSLVWASTALPLPLSASGLPVIGWSLPSNARVTCIDVSLPSAPTIF